MKTNNAMIFTDDEYKLLYIALRTYAMSNQATDADRAKIDSILEKIIHSAATQAIIDRELAEINTFNYKNN